MSQSHHRHDPFDSEREHAAQRISLRTLTIAVALTLGFAGVEWVAALISGSLALMADAGHMVTDASALFLALTAQWLARRGPTVKSSYGEGRIEALAAFVNSLAMLGLVAWISIEAVQRFGSPRNILGETVMIVAALGLVVNLMVAWVLSRDQRSINTRAALVHVMGDLLGSVAALGSGAVIWLTGWTPIDPILSLLVCGLILRSTWSLLRSSYRILMEQVPDSVDFKKVAAMLEDHPNVSEVHNLHIWETSPEHIHLTAHLVIQEMALWPETLREIQAKLRTLHGIDHATIQPEFDRDQKP